MKRRYRIVLPTMVAVILAIAFATSAQAEIKTIGGNPVIGVVSFSGYNAFIRDVDLIGRLGDRPGLAQTLEGMLAMFTGGKGVVGLDKSLPWGVAIYGIQPLPLAFIPVNDLDGFVGAVNPLLQGQIKPLGNGQYQLDKDGKQVFLKQHGDYVFASLGESILNDLPDSPVVLLNGLPDQFDFAVQFNVQAVPDSYRNLTLEQIRRGFHHSMQRLDSENDSQFQKRKQIAETQLQNLEAMIGDLYEVSFGWNLDENQELATADVSFTGLPGSDLSRIAEMLKPVPSQFAGFIDDQSQLSCNVTSQIDADDAEQGAQRIELFRQQVLRSLEHDKNLSDEQKRSAVKRAVNELLDVVCDTLRAGMIDGAIWGDRDQFTTFLAGLRVTDGHRIEEAVKGLVEVSVDNDKLGLQWDMFQHNGVSFHSFSGPDNGSFDDLFGPQPEVLLGFAQNRVYVALGTNTRDKIVGAIVRSENRADTPVAPFELRISPSGFMHYVEDATFDQVRDIWDQAEGKYQLVLRASSIRNGSRYRLQCETGFVRAMAKTIGASFEHGFNQGLKQSQITQ